MTSPPRLPSRLARLHAWARRQAWLHRFTLANRLLLALAFFPTGLVKATGQRFTTLPLEDPVGFFFEAMYQTGPYWRFIGVTQIVAALLLLVPRTATLGAMLFLPISVSILLITWGVGFTGTVYIAAGMLLSVVYLLCWDADRLWAGAHHVLAPPRKAPSLLAGAHLVERAGWVLGTVAGVGIVFLVRGFGPPSLMRVWLMLGVVAALLVPLGWVLAAIRGREGAAQRPLASTSVSQE